MRKQFLSFQYAGKWFDVYRYEDDFSFGCKCVNMNFELIENKFSVIKCCARPKISNYCNEGSAVVSFPNQNPVEGKLNISYIGREF